MALIERQRELLEDLRELHDHLRDEARAKYKRINPFAEDLF